MIVIGIDPGKAGGMAIMDSHSHYTVTKMPDTERDTYDVLREWRDAHSSTGIKALIEKVHAMPKQGVSSTFAFGKNYGFLRGCLTALEVPFDEVSPAQWQRKLGCLTKGNKNISKQKAQQLFPDTKMTHAIADALLIAYYGYQHHFTGE